MKKRRLSMRKVREILRLRHGKGFSFRKVSEVIGVAPSTIGECVRKAAAAGLSWPIDDTLTDQFLEDLLYVKTTEQRQNLPEPDYEKIHLEIPKKGLTLQLLWQEYKEIHPNGYEYSQFCKRYKDWARSLDLSMRQAHAPGDKAFVDYAGKTVPIHCRQSGVVLFEAQIFVGVLGASNYTFARAYRSQKKECWIRSHIDMFEHFGGVPEKIIPDNLKSAISKACNFDPDINPTYLELAKHYDTVIMPARVGKPKDKAKAEIGVNMVTRWILAAIRNETFFSLAELNGRIETLLNRLNNKKFQKLEGTRVSRFLEIDKPALKKLPPSPYSYTNIKLAKVHVDYHVEIEKHFYSVPSQLARNRVEVRYNDSIVEIFYEGKKVSSHMRSYQNGRFTTIPEHMPSKHQAYAKWTPERLTKWAEKSGENTRKVAEAILQSKKHPELGFKAVLGLIRLSKQYGNERLETACKKALEINSPSYKSVKSILKTGIDQKEANPERKKRPVPKHNNIRGSEYYSRQF